MTAGSIAVPTIIPLRAPSVGKSKLAIDTNTKIEINSDSPKTSLFFTINGSKPEPFQKIGSRGTIAYKRPFCLPAGKHTVKAVAVAEDGVRESHIVTKTFEVEFVEPPDYPPEDDDYGFQHDLQMEKSKLQLKRATSNLMTSTKSAWTDTGRQNQQRKTDMRITGSTQRRPHSGTRFLNSRMGHHSDRSYRTEHLDSLDLARSESRQSKRRSPPDNTTQALRLQRETDFLKCIYCFANRPADPFCTYCTTCGNPLPEIPSKRLTPPEPGQNAVLNKMSAPPVTNHDSSYVRCNKCSRVNNGDAGFCDWCGTKPSALPGMLQCTLCGAGNDAYSAYCGGCSVKIEAPGRTVMKMDGTGKSLFLPVTQSMSKVPTPVVHSGTQTVGLFYPSRGPVKHEPEEKPRERKPLLTPVSPGRGYWRKQIDHICQHLKIYTQNNPEFRALIGEPKMGKLINSTIQEDGYELSITMNFPLRGSLEKTTGKKLGVSHQGYLSQHTEREDIESYRSDSDDFESEENFTPKSGKKKTVKKTKPKKKAGPKLSTVDQQLLKELGSEGEGAATEVQQLLDEGADVNCVNKNGLPAIYLAVKNKHIDAIPVLVDGGLDVNKKLPSAMKGNTVLHEAVNLGPSYLKVIDVLLEFGADQNRKNDRGETPLDLAKKGGYDSIITRFVSALGQAQLNKMTKSKQ